MHMAAVNAERIRPPTTLELVDRTITACYIAQAPLAFFSSPPSAAHF